MYIEVNKMPMRKIPAMKSLGSVLQISNTSEEPVYQLGAHIAVDESAKVSARDHVAIELKNGRNLVAVYAGEQDGQAFFYRFTGTPSVQHVAVGQIKSMRKIVAMFAPGFGSFK